MLNGTFWDLGGTFQRPRLGFQDQPNFLIARHFFFFFFNCFSGFKNLAVTLFTKDQNQKQKHSHTHFQLKTTL